MPRRGVAQQTAFIRRNVVDVARQLLREPAPPTPAGRRALVVLIGLPGAGKSHVARLLAERLGAVTVSSDALRRRIFVAPAYDRAETRAVFALAHAMTRLLLEDAHTVILDATHLRERDRGPAYDLARDTSAALVLVHVTAPEHVIRARLADRAAGGSPLDLSEADARVFELMRERYEAPARPVLVLDSAGDLQAGIARVEAEVCRACA